jgi:eukaryotic-like serine/threonine-protein kinase
MAEVFKARAVGTAGFARDVVIKRILPAYGRDPEFVKMFVDEAKILGLLHHPNVVQALDFGEDGGVLFLALEYIEGPSLSRVLRALRGANRRIQPAVAAYIGREICRALDHVHNLNDADGTPLGVVHRDVTPSNVMLTPAGGVKLLDFGVAKFSTAAQVTKSGTVKGKPAYLAPEQLQGKAIDGRVDLFAVGILLHEMLSLEHLFAGDSDLGTVRRIMEMDVPAPSSKRPDIAPELDAIVLKALSRDRARRYASAAEMARALDDFVIASRLHVDEVGAFVREIEAMAVPARAPTPASALPAAWQTTDGGGTTLSTLREGEPVARFGTLALRGRSRAALLGAVAFVVLGLLTALGVRVSITTTHASAAPALPAASATDASGATAAFGSLPRR